MFVWGWNSAGALGVANRAVREQRGYVTQTSTNENGTPTSGPETHELLAEPTHLLLPESIVWISCGERHAGAVTGTNDTRVTMKLLTPPLGLLDTGRNKQILVIVK